MSTYAVLSRCRRTVVATAVGAVFPLAGLAADNVPPEALNVKVLPDRYVAAGKQFVDLAALEAWAKPIQIRTLWLDSCGNTSTKRLLAAVERFHAVYAEGGQIPHAALGIRAASRRWPTSRRRRAGCRPGTNTWRPTGQAVA